MVSDMWAHMPTTFAYSSPPLPSLSPWSAMEEGAAAAAAAAEGVAMVQVRGGDGVVFMVEADRLAELQPGFIWDMPAIESDDIYAVAQTYRDTIRHFTDPATGELLPGADRSVDAIFEEHVQDLDTLGHVARAAIHLGMNDLLGVCYGKVLELLLHIGAQQVMHFLQIPPGLL